MCNWWSTINNSRYTDNIALMPDREVELQQIADSVIANNEVKRLRMNV